MNSSYSGDLQDRLRNLSIRAKCPTRQENGQRYLGPPIHWTTKPPQNSEVFISKLPADCFEDEIYDFCSLAGDIYLIRLMINFENENRGFCFVTFANHQQAAAAVMLLSQKAFRKGHYIHVEISLNNCSLKMYGLDYHFDDETLENEIRMNTKDLVNVTIKRNTAQRSLMATLYFDTHQKAAIARRKLSQIANSRWGQSVKVFLWSKKLQNKHSNQKHDSGDLKNYENDKFTKPSTESSSLRRILSNFDVNSFNNEQNHHRLISKPENIKKSNVYSWITSSPEFTINNFNRKSESSGEDSLMCQDYGFSSPEHSHDSNSNYSTIDPFDDSFFSSLSSTFSNDQLSPPKFSYEEPTKNEYSWLESPVHNVTSVNNENSSIWESEHLTPQYMDFIDFPDKSEPNLFDFNFPGNISPQKTVRSPVGYSPNKQIEVILNEASEALGNFNLDSHFS